MTKEQKGILKRYLMADKKDLLECYTTYSNKKAQAQNAILKEMFEAPKGRGYKIISYNGWMFTCGYLYTIDYVDHLVYHTPTRRVDIEIR